MRCTHFVCASSYCSARADVGFSCLWFWLVCLDVTRCHHVADSQGFMFEKTHVIRTASRGVPQCIDSTGVKDGEAVQLSDCDDQNQGMLWDLDADTHLLKNRLSGLCLDPMVDPAKYPEAAKNMKKAPAGVSACDASSKFQKFQFREI